MKTNKKIGRLLSSVPILAKLTTSERNKLGGAMESKKFSKGDVIIKQGDDATGFFILRRGQVVVTCTKPSGDDEKIVEEELGRLKEGDYFGEAALLNPGSKRNATVTALTDVKCFFLDQDSFKAFFTKDTRMQIKFAQRVAVSAESDMKTEAPTGATKEKDEKTVNLILEAINNNPLFKNREKAHKVAVIAEMWQKEIKKGTEIIKQGARGDTFYVVQEGKFEVYINDKYLLTYEAKSAFGELALMYNTPRAATVKAIEDSVCWVVDRNTFRRVIKDLSGKKLARYVEFLKKVDLLSPLAGYEREKIAEALEKAKYKSGEVIFKQGDEGDAMYIIRQGEVEITKTEDGSSDVKTIGRIGKEIGRAVQQECRDRSRMPSSA
eukprot:TRINITY_DN1642_c0_g1_i2.p1 TRINITY_DN1642_c0_g1~~TRINITY_DN1642_c0_g1_i2.p1  ORF type:complete len:443 (-),score=99.44 TRINITY_DN1642_c0_g1_i2:23-1162(-)